MKATEQFFPMILFIMLYKVLLTFEFVVHEILLNSKLFEVLEGRCGKGSKRGGQQPPQQQGGHHGNQATAHLQASANTTLRNQCMERIIIQECGWGGGKGKSSK